MTTGTGALEAALLDRLRRPLSLGRTRKASMALDVEDGDGWSLYLEAGTVRLGRGLDPKADTTVTTDADTMVGILDGDVSGVEAFISGRLSVRGNLALSLRLSGSVDGPGGNVRFPKARDVEAGGTQTFLMEGGEGFPIIALHGLGATNSSILTTLWELAADHRVIAPDMPGFGDSAKPIRSYDAPFFGRWAISLLDALGIEKAHFVGNSLGGRVALEAALIAPERVGKVVLYAPSPAFIRRREFTRLVRVLRPEMALLPLPLAHKHVVRSTKAMFSRPDRLPETWYEAAADEFLRIFRSARGRMAFFSAARQIYLEEPYGDEGFWDRLGGLERPSLFLWGERDRLVPARFAKHVERALPNAQSVVLPDCGHVPQFEHPERTHALTREFLAA